MALQLRDRRGRPLDWEAFRTRYLTAGYADVADDEIVTDDGVVVLVHTVWTGATSVTMADGKDDEMTENDEKVFLFESRIVGGRYDGMSIGHDTLLAAIRRHDLILMSIRAGQSLKTDGADDGEESSG